MQSNINALKKLTNIKQDADSNATIDGLASKVGTSAQPIATCSPSRPFYNGKKCIKCDDYGLYDIKTLSCINPALYTNVTALKANKKFI